jgi:hypothetical protein
LRDGCWKRRLHSEVITNDLWAVTRALDDIHVEGIHTSTYSKDIEIRSHFSWEITSIYTGCNTCFTVKTVMEVRKDIPLVC